MEVQAILLDIPPGVVTFASAIFAALVLVIVTFGTWVLRLLFSIQGRLTVLEQSWRHSTPIRFLKQTPEWKFSGNSIESK